MHTTTFFRKQEAGLQIFVKGWELYQKIIECNYMKHHEVVTALRSALAEVAKESLSIVEVGCGDAYAVGEALNGEQTIEYTGVDMSQHALDHARKNLMPRGWQLDLRVGNMFEVVPRLEAGIDVVLAGYSLHHFGSDRKEILLQRFRPLLNPNGKVIIYDLFRREKESREDYLERLLQSCRESWNEMSDEQMEQIHEHVRENDHPESLQSMKQLADHSGYDRCECVYRDEDEFYGVVEME